MAQGNMQKITNNSGTGYCQMPDGTLMHWGSVSIPRAAGINQADSATLSPAFVGTPVQVFSTYPTTSPQVYSHECQVSSGKIRAYLYNNGSAFDTNGVVYYFAIGRWK